MSRSAAPFYQLFDTRRTNNNILHHLCRPPRSWSRAELAGLNVLSPSWPSTLFSFSDFDDLNLGSTTMSLRPNILNLRKTIRGFPGKKEKTHLVILWPLSHLSPRQILNPFWALTLHHAPLHVRQVTRELLLLLQVNWCFTNTTSLRSISPLYLRPLLNP